MKKKRNLGYVLVLLVAIMSFMAVQAMAEQLKLVVSDEFKQEASKRALINGIVASGQTSAIFLEVNEVPIETISGVIEDYFTNLGLDERYTAFRVMDMEEASIIAPVIDMAVIFSMLKEVHDCHECKKDLDPKKLANLEGTFFSIREMLRASMVNGEGAVHLGEALAYRSYNMTKDMSAEVGKVEAILEGTDRDIEILTGPGPNPPN